MEMRVVKDVRSELIGGKFVVGTIRERNPLPN